MEMGRAPFSSPSLTSHSPPLTLSHYPWTWVCNLGRRKGRTSPEINWHDPLREHASNKLVNSNERSKSVSIRLQIDNHRINSHNVFITQLLFNSVNAI
jgi:hypothetical protein